MLELCESILRDNMKCAAVSILASLALVSQAFAVLRLLFPVKPAPPFSGETIVVGDDLVRGSAKEAAVIKRLLKNKNLNTLTRQLW
jgi:hypothetical protein